MHSSGISLKSHDISVEKPVDPGSNPGALTFKMIKTIKNEIELQGDVFFIFKHSEICPISVAADNVVRKAESEIKVPIYKLIVQNARDLSNKIAEKYEIKHESPQMILIKDGKAIWNQSHYNINEENIKEAIGLIK